MADDKIVPSQDDDIKQRFRAALDKKNGVAQDGVPEEQHAENVHGRTDTHQHGARREFRRKAGG